MTYKIICPVENNKVTVTLPPDFQDKTEVTVYVNDEVSTRSRKLEAMKLAATDPLFLADIREVQTDFDSIDGETI